MHACCLFLHYQPLTGTSTMAHLERIRRLNPEVFVVPLTFMALPRRPRRSANMEWRHCDVLVYLWFKAMAPRYDHYYVLEEDTLCTQSFQDFYGTARHFDAASAVVHTPKDTGRFFFDAGVPACDWDCFNVIKNSALAPYAWCMAPISGMLFSHRALTRMVELRDRHYAEISRLYCECRLGTLACMAGYAPQIIRPDAQNFLHFNPRNPNRPGIWHPVKT